MCLSTPPYLFVCDPSLCLSSFLSTYLSIYLHISVFPIPLSLTPSLFSVLLGLLFPCLSVYCPILFYSPLPLSMYYSRYLCLSLLLSLFIFPQSLSLSLTLSCPSRSILLPFSCLSLPTSIPPLPTSISSSSPSHLPNYISMPLSLGFFRPFTRLP